MTGGASYFWPFKEWDISDAKNYIDGVKSLFVIIGIIIGGFWTIYLFYTLGKANLASAQLAKAQKESIHQGTLEIGIANKTLSHEAEGNLHVISVKIKNVGTRNLYLDIGGWIPLKIGLVDVGEDNNIKWAGKILEFKSYRVKGAEIVTTKGLNIRAGDSSELTFIARLEKTGLYFVQFAVPLSPLELQVFKSTRKESLGDELSAQRQNELPCEKPRDPDCPRHIAKSFIYVR